MVEPKPGIVTGQRVSRAKYERARELRREPTGEEAILWRHLRANRLDGLHFRRQQVISGFIADFYCHVASLVLELDGPAHESSYDEERDNVLESLGLQVLCFKNHELREDLDRVLRTSSSTARARIGSS
jgi:very-short-patch-repair endonuclease